jgi:drug/metabolite transporter (DMT)-like permease
LNLGVPLGLGSGLCWGAADFFGGVQSRHLPALTVAFWSQVAGALAIAAALAIVGTPPSATGFAWGLAAGVGGGCALTLFYRGLAEGTMSIVAPISACGAIVPVAAALLTGNQPGTLAALGVLTAITGIILVSRPTSTGTPERPANPGSPANPGASANRGRSGRVVAMALGAALGFGDTGANLLFAYAVIGGNLAVVGVLGSLYPVATVVLARWLLGERLSGGQNAGVVLALTGVGLLAAA